MVSECREYLIKKLKDAGIRAKPYTSMKLLERCQDSHLAAVLFDSDALARNGSKKIYKDASGTTKKRRKIFDRTVTYNVIIGDPEATKTEQMFDALLSGVDTGIYLDSNYVSITVGDADWVEKDDSILKAKVAVQVKISFAGGVYRDTDFAKIKDIEIQTEREMEG